nr:Ycf68 [Eucommia ulmoides]
MAYSSCSNRGLKPKLLLRRIDGAIQVRSNVDPTFDSLVGSGRSGGGTPTAPLFSRIHTSLISVWTAISRAQVQVRPQWENQMEHLTTHLHRPRTTRSPLSFWGDGGIVPFEPFIFHAFPGGLEKAAINRISLILPSRG